MPQPKLTSTVAIVAYILVFAALTAVVWFEVIDGIGREYVAYPAAVTVLLVGIAIVGSIVGRKLSHNAVSLASAAYARGFDYTPEVRAPGLPGLLFRAGSRVTVTSLIDATSSETPFLAGSLTGQYAMETSTPRLLAASFVAIPLARTVPNIVLLGTGFGILKRAGLGLDGRQRLGLEGDFDKSFALHVPAGYERDALEIFTPNLMQLLLDTTAGCDVELVDDWMFVYSGLGKYNKPESLDGLVAVTEHSRATIERQTSRYRDDRSARAASHTISPDEHAARVGRVAAAGSRVKTRDTLFQRVITIGSSLLLVGALAYVFVVQILPSL